MRKLYALIGSVVVLLAAGVGGKTLTMPSRQLAVAPVTPVSVDSTAAAARLGAAVRWRTVSSVDDDAANADQFDGLQALLRSSFRRRTRCPAHQQPAARRLTMDLQ